MWGIVKIIIGIILVVFLAQFAFNGISNILNSNANVRGSWQTELDMDTQVKFHETPASHFWDFVPRPVYQAAVDLKARAVRLFEEGRAAVLRSMPRKA
jgi:hypothetical protein